MIALLLLVAAGYFAFNLGEVYWRYYKFRDAMTQEARFAAQFSDRDIISHLQAKADSLGLPAEAGAVRVERTRNGITIATDYSEVVELPLVAREIRFTPSVERSF
ncbi:MAG: hypothetical protein M3373_03965 [Gemmatimonadota bacterium]|nr:hypothetical protein [Gemmatimonadota bacterium]